ncbi:hypothetical protein EDC96DRAFT_548805 [Choanephora cucurbitarum]|nr:hypothetical protein EDC96DRAFT_548801 [Choanephora cucurbitarum]KAI8331131.1 hypothetical protein EDC96DRAFT_548805 [Choanephora cucurbitarum]
MSFSSGFELIIRLYLYNRHKSSRVTDVRITMTNHHLALSLGYTKHFIAASNVELGTKKCGRLMLYCLYLLAISKYLQKCSSSISFVTATQLHIFTSVSDMNSVFGLACLSEFASSLFQISNMFVIVTQEGQEDCQFEPYLYQYDQL